MEIMGVMAFVLILLYSSYPAKVKRLEKEMKKIRRELKGETTMSKLIEKLIGHTCVIECDDAPLLTGNTTLSCTVIDADDEWVHLRYKDKKQVEKERYIRVDTINHIELGV